MSRIIIVLISFSFVFFYQGLSFAGVALSGHDMFAKGRDVDSNVCSYCHVPHNAAGKKIWSSWANEAQLRNGPSTSIGNMCYTCHDGTVSRTGLGTVFNAQLQQHKLPRGRDCDMCHSVHDNTNGKFMNVAKKQGSYCAGCHDKITNAGNLGDFTGSTNHPSFWQRRPLHNTGAPCAACHDRPGSQKYKGCYLCHSRAHGAVNYSTEEVSHPILRSANTDSAFCETCHPVNVQNVSGGNKHPANLAAAGAWGKLYCQDCHDVHQPGVENRPAILKHENADSAYCTTCHRSQDSANGPAIGEHTHPVGVNFASIGLTQAGNNIDDNNDRRADYPNNSASIICETCHSVHRKGVDQPLLRISDDTNLLCLNCHNANL